MKVKLITTKRNYGENVKKIKDKNYLKNKK